MVKESHGGLEVWHEARILTCVSTVQSLTPAQMVDVAARVGYEYVG
jgi:hypothetical protein